MNDIVTVISSLGFPIVAAVGLFFACRYLLEVQQKNVDKMFEMYDKANSENREVIKNLNDSVNRLCEKLDKLEDIK